MDEDRAKDDDDSEGNFDDVNEDKNDGDRFFCKNPTERWADVDPLCARAGSGIFTDVDDFDGEGDGFSPDPSLLSLVRENIKVLVVGAGGLGCELLKDLTLSGFKHIDVIDMDTIDVSNLNRQFLFTEEDVGEPKATRAARAVNRRVRGAKVTGHYKRIEDMEDNWYRQFHVVVMGLDSIEARRYINKVYCSFLEFERESGEAREGTWTPLIDGGTEGFKGHARVIIPGKTPCFECTTWLFPPQTTFPLCTIAETPRSAAHCIEHAKIVQFPEEYTDEKEGGVKGGSGGGVTFDGDNPDHVTWVYKRALKRAESFGIPGVTYNHTLGVVKNIVPAIPSTNAIVSAYCAFEAFKIATGCLKSMDNYVMYAGSDKVYQNLMKLYKDEGCSQCGRGLFVQRVFDLEEATLADVLDAIESEHENMFGKREKEKEEDNVKKKDNKEGDKKEKDDMMDTAKGITGVSSDGATVWMGGVLASQYEENLSKLASDVFSVTIVANDDEEEKDDDESTRNKKTVVEKTIHVNSAKLPSPLRVGLVFEAKSRTRRKTSKEGKERERERERR